MCVNEVKQFNPAVDLLDEDVTKSCSKWSRFLAVITLTGRPLQKGKPGSSVSAK
jgi:hypothetical protein